MKSSMERVDLKDRRDQRVLRVLKEKRVIPVLRGLRESRAPRVRKGCRESGEFQPLNSASRRILSPLTETLMIRDTFTCMDWISTGIRLTRMG